MNQQIAQKTTNDNINEDEEDEDDIIINDEFSDENDTTIMVNLVPDSLNKMKVFDIKTQLEIINTKQSIQQLTTQQIDSRDIHIELPNSSKLVYQEKEVSLEKEYINKIKKLSKENKELKQNNEKLEKEIKEMAEEIKASNDIIENEKQKSKNDSVQKLEPYIKEYEAITKKTTQLEDNNKRLMRQVDNYKLEYDKLQNDLQFKSQKIEELNMKISQIESQLNKNEINDSDNKQNDTKDNGETIEESNKLLTKLENQLSIAIDQLHQFTNDNFKLKQELSKSRIPTPLIIDNSNNNNGNNYNTNNSNSKSRINNENDKELEIESNYKHQLNNTRHHKTNSEYKLNQIQQSPDISDTTYIKKKNTTNYNSNETNSLFTTQFETAMKESKILEIETTLYKLQKERDKLTEELARLPEYPKHRNVINKKRTLEISIKDYNGKIEKNKQKISEIKAEAYNE